MSSYSRRIAAPAPASNAFPQADSLPRLLDVLALACHSPKLDEAVLAEIWGISGRQGAYYCSAATYVGLIYKRGGWIKPTAAGERVNRLGDEAERRAAVFDMVLQLPVFREAAAHAAEWGELPPAEEVAAWVRAEDPRVNETTAARRAETVNAWVGMVMRDAPETVEALRPAAPALGAA